MIIEVIIMKSILEEIYFGEWQPGEAVTLKDGTIQALEQSEKWLMEHLGREERGYLLELLDAQSSETGEVAVENFISGFRAGARLMLEIFPDACYNGEQI